MLAILTTADLITAVLVFGLSFVGTRIVAKILVQRAILDQPNHRSSHTAPTPRGGGIAVVGAITVGWFVAVLLGDCLLYTSDAADDS